MTRTTRLGKRADRDQPKTRKTTMKTETDTNAASGPNCQRRLVRRLPIDWNDIARQSGCTKGKLCRSPGFGWGVQNGNGGVHFAIIDPPETKEDETLVIEDGSHWAIYTSNQ